MKATHSCGASWTGGSACHCASCHATFTGLTHFDAHHVRDKVTGGVTCRTPASMGLIEVRAGVWGTRMNHEERAKFLTSVRGCA